MDKQEMAGRWGGGAVTAAQTGQEGMEGDTMETDRERSTGSNPVWEAGKSERMGAADLGIGEMCSPSQVRGCGRHHR